jgi:hypothetical protein
MINPATGSGELAGADQLKSTSCATDCPVPERAMEVVLPEEELLLMVS